MVLVDEKSLHFHQLLVKLQLPTFILVAILYLVYTFGSVGRCQILLENEISIFKKLVRKHEVLQNVLVNGCSDVGFQKTQWTNTSR